MFPSKLVRRAGIVSGVATGTFLFAMAATPAFAIGTPTLGLGSPCPAPALASLIPTGLECVDGVLVTIASQLPIPTPAPTSATPKTSASPTPTPNPLTGLVGGVTGTVTNLGKTLTGVSGTVTGVTSTVTGSLGSGGGVPGLPGTPSSSPTSVPTAGSSGAATGGSSASGAGSSSSSSGSSGSSSSAKKPGSGSGVLSAAAFLPGSGLASFVDPGSSSISPLADTIPSPLVAAPESKLAAVQAPLIAAGDRASRQADSLLTGFGGKALPGILVILATAMVAAVGAGNLRAWQSRLVSAPFPFRRRRG